MLKKTVNINEEKNEYRIIEKRKKEDCYLNTLLSYMCTSTDNYENKYEKKTLRNGKKY